MKPCARNRKRIAWLALGALDAGRARELRVHLERCEGCRGYLNEISSVSESLRAADVSAALQTTEAFHRRVARALRIEASQPARAALFACLRADRLNWRVALPTLGAIAAVMVLFGWVRHPAVPRDPPPAEAKVAADRNGSLLPTLASYQAVANRSLDDLDDLLTRQAKRRLPAAPIHTASAWVPAGFAD